MSDDSTGADAGATDTDSAATGADALADTAVRAVEAGGDYLREAFDDGGTPADYTAEDVKAEADREAERRVLDAIADAHPDHRVSAEESGDHDGDGDYRWVVDALDGTNNFAAGIPTFGVAATACERSGPGGPENEPVATAVHVPVLGDTYVAERGNGVRYNGAPVEVTDGRTLPPEKATVATIIGPEVVSGGAERREWEAVVDAVGEVPKRVVETWAPVVYWGLLARGKLEGFVCYHPAEREQVAGSLLALEAGAVARAEGPLTVFGADRALRDALFDAATEAL